MKFKEMLEILQTLSSEDSGTKTSVQDGLKKVFEEMKNDWQ